MSVSGLNLKLLKKAIESPGYSLQEGLVGQSQHGGAALPVFETSGINRWVRTRVPRVLGRLRTAVRTVSSTLKIPTWHGPLF